jgi:hypothetical protein
MIMGGGVLGYVYLHGQEENEGPGFLIFVNIVGTPPFIYFIFPLRNGMWPSHFEMSWT